jgi:hypothetical protein
MNCAPAWGACRNPVREQDWENLFRVLGRTYIAIRGKMRQIRRDRARG